MEIALATLIKAHTVEMLFIGTVGASVGLALGVFLTLATFRKRLRPYQEPGVEGGAIKGER